MKTIGHTLAEPFWVEAGKVFCSSARPDMAAKLEFAQSYIRLGYVPDGVLTRYRNSIFAMNGFYEASPKKMGFEEFYVSFIDLIESLKLYGYLPSFGPVPVSPGLVALNGAHRVAAATALGLKVLVSTYKNLPSFGFDFFAERLTEEDLDLAALTFIRECKNTRAVIAHSTVSEILYGQILSEFEQIADILRIKVLELDTNLYINLKKINYLNPLEFERSSWAGSPENKFRGLRGHVRDSTGGDPIRVIFFRNKNNAEAIVERKEKIRRNAGKDRHYVHTTASHLETFILASSILHRESLLALQNRPHELWNQLDTLYFTTSKTLGNDVLPNQKIVLGGSASLEAHGIRRANDLDVIVDSVEAAKECFERDCGGFEPSYHLAQSEGYPISAAEISRDFDRHLYVNGFKVASLDVIRKMKLSRAKGPKDSMDLVLISKYQELQNSNNSGEGVTGLFLARLSYLLAGTSQKGYLRFMRAWDYALSRGIKIKAFILRKIGL